MTNSEFEQKWQKLKEIVLGTGVIPTESMLESVGLPTDLDYDVVEEQLFSVDCEVCPDCGFWVDSGEVAEVENGMIVCLECAGATR